MKVPIPDPDYEAKLRVVLRVQERMAKRVDKFDEAIKYLREEDRKEGGNTYYDEIADLIRDLRAHVLVLEAAQPQNDPDEDVENGDEPAQEAAGQDPHNNGQSFYDNFERFAIRPAHIELYTDNIQNNCGSAAS